jgi:hypothetical protein
VNIKIVHDVIRIVVIDETVFSDREINAQSDYY